MSNRVIVFAVNDNPPQWPTDPALFLDLDGTLLEFATDPSEVGVSPRLRRILDRLPEATNGAVAFVSGRTMEDLDRLLAPSRFPIAAVHGLERRDAYGKLTRAAEEFEARNDIHVELKRIVAQYPGTLLENKGIALALHYRRCPESKKDLLARVEATLEKHAAHLRLMQGNMVLEIKPDGADKGSAIEAFMREKPFAGRRPVFVGDDVTDEDGFRIVNALGGISVKVDSGSSIAQYRLSDTAAVLDWLEDFIKEER